jgi:hypothetical protein
VYNYESDENQSHGEQVGFFAVRVEAMHQERLSPFESLGMMTERRTTLVEYTYGETLSVLTALTQALFTSPRHNRILA